MAAAQCILLTMNLASVKYIPSDVSSPISVQERMHCARLCAINETCISLIYNKVTKDCFLHRRRASESDAHNYPVTNDVVMYNTNRNPCSADQGYVMNKNIWLCYKLHVTKKTNSLARDTCLNEGGDGLVRIDNAQKLEFLAREFISVHIDGQLTAGKWVFFNGDLVQYQLFRQNEPSGDGPCMNILKGGLNDVSCSHENKFICERRI